MNEDVKQLAKSNRVPLWKVANSIGVADTTFSKWLRKELSDTKKQEIIRIINDLKEREV